MLEKEFKYFLDNQEELVKKYKGKFLVIKGTEIVGVYNSNAEAYQRSVEKFELGTFLIQECLPGQDTYTQTFYSRAVFN